MSDKHLSNIAFSSFNLPPLLLQGIEEAGFTRCTPIQAETLPLALAGRDVSGQAQTGTGKTAAFLIAVFNRLLTEPAAATRQRNQPRAIIIAPTRELAVQIHKEAMLVGKYMDFKLGLVFGGTGYESQRKQLEQGVDIIIGTPGRLIDFFKQHLFNLKAIQVLVLDEADRMFDLGFLKDIRFLLRSMPKPGKRLGLLFSATLSYRVNELAYEHMNNPQLVVIESEQVTADNVKEYVFHPAKEEKIPLLLSLLQRKEATRSMVFVNTKRTAENVVAYLKGNGIDAAVLSGDVPQKQRMHLLKQFTEGQLPILVATDVAARGLHIPEVSHVFNYDLPQDPEDYVHRIGRTARAGAAGEAISFACEDYALSLIDIEEYIGHKIPVEQMSSELLVKPQPPVREKSNLRRQEFKNKHRTSGNGSSPADKKHKRRSPRKSSDSPMKIARPIDR